MPSPEELVLELIETRSRKEPELADRSDRWYSVPAWPYRTIDNRINGAILTFVDIGDVKQWQ